MILSSGCNSLDPIDSAPVNSLVTDVGERDMGELKVKEKTKENEKQVIVNNYYIGDGEKGWKQLVGGEIPPNISRKGTQDKSSEISPNKTPLEESSRHSNINHEEQNSNQGKSLEVKTIEEPMKYHSEEAEAQNMAPPHEQSQNTVPLASTQAAIKGTTQYSVGGSCALAFTKSSPPVEATEVGSLRA